MMRSATIVLLALAFAAPALAGDTAKPQANAEKTAVESPARFHYANTVERLRGKPYVVRATMHPVDGATASEKVWESLPSANFMIEGQAGLGGH